MVWAARQIEVNEEIVIITTKGEAIALGIAQMTTVQMDISAVFQKKRRKPRSVQTCQ